MQGVRTHVSDQNRITACTTALNNIPETRGMEPSRPIFLTSHVQIFRAYQRFPTTSGQSSSAAVKTHPRYLNEVTVSRGMP